MARGTLPRRYGGQYPGGFIQRMGAGRADRARNALAGWAGRFGYRRDDAIRPPRFVFLVQRDRWGREQMAAHTRRLDGQHLDLAYRLTPTDGPGDLKPFPGPTRRITNWKNLEPWDADYALDLGQQPA